VEDLRASARLVTALRPWLDQLVVVGGWAHRLHRFHPLTPLHGSGVKRSGRPDATVSRGGITAQKMRCLDLLLVSPWAVRVGAKVGVPVATNTDVLVPNATSFIVQKLLIHADRPAGKSQGGCWGPRDTRVERIARLADESSHRRLTNADRCARARPAPHGTHLGRPRTPCRTSPSSGSPSGRRTRCHRRSAGPGTLSRSAAQLRGRRRFFGASSTTGRPSASTDRLWPRIWLA
jgi:hypothetical protein